MSSTTVSTNSSVASGTKGHDYWPNDLYTTIKTDKKATKTTLSSISISKAEQEYVCVPAHSFKIFNNLSVSPNLLITCIKNDDYPKAIKPVGNYEESNSPLNPNRSLDRLTYVFVPVVGFPNASTLLPTSCLPLCLDVETWRAASLPQRHRQRRQPICTAIEWNRFGF